MTDTRLGTILLETGAIDETELERCLEIQSLVNDGRPLGQILVEQRLLTKQQLDHLLAVQDARRARADAMLEFDLLDPDRYLEAAVTAGASELHLSEGRQALARIGGRLCALGSEHLGGPEVWQFVQDYMGAEVLEAIADQQTVTRELNLPGVARGRITAFRHFEGIGISIRLHPQDLRDPVEAGIDRRVIEAVRAGKGLILISGERSSGVSETLATLLHVAAEDPTRMVVALDDTLEFPEFEGSPLVSLRRVGDHTRDYVTGLQSALREDPNAIFVGNATDPAAFDLSLLAAESGRLVVAVVHGSSAITTLERIIDFYPSYDQRRARAVLASVLQCVYYLRLLPSTDRREQCLVSELLWLDDTVREVLRAGSFPQLELLHSIEGGRHGYSLDSHLRELIATGRIRVEDAYLHTRAGSTDPLTQRS